MLNNLQAGSLGCAPTPNQYFALEVSSLMSLIALPSPEGGGLGTGSYVPAKMPKSRGQLEDINGMVVAGPALAGEGRG